MKKIGRLGLRVSAGLVGLAAALVVLCLDGVDYRPYLRSPYYAETSARLRERLTNATAVRGELTAGFGRARLTPIISALPEHPAQGQFHALPLAGYGGRHGRPATGVHDELYVKAVALRVGDRLVVIVGADALIIPREVAETAVARLGHELGLRREQVYLGATHTHSSLGGWGEGMVAEAFAGPYQPGVRLWFADRIVDAVRGAVADLKPASFGYGHFAAPEFIRNRLVGRMGRVDPEFSYALIRKGDGRLAVWGSFSAHATVLSDNNMEFSGDYPGYWQREIEQATGGMAVFLAGGVGSHSPVPGGGGFNGAERMGQTLARAVLDRLPQTPLTNSLPFGIVGLEVSLPPLHARISDGFRFRPWIAARLLPVTPRSFIQAFRLGDSIWVSTPCDFSGELALGIKDDLRTRGCHAVITSFNGDYIGYIIPARYYHMDGYEPRLMSFFGPNVPDYFDDLIRTMTLELVSTRSPISVE